MKLKEKDSGEFYFKKYDAKDIKILKNGDDKKVDKEEEENLAELKELEKLEKQDQKQLSQEDEIN